MPEPVPPAAFAAALPAALPARGPAQVLCPSAALVERGKAVLFDVRLWGQPARAFALRFDGKLVAYVNRCAHVPVEMDWQPGDFLDHDKRWIVCSIHGATYEPADGRCVGGPCGRSRLVPVQIDEQDGQACWYPCPDVRLPLAPAAPAPESQLP